MIYHGMFQVGRPYGKSILQKMDELRVDCAEIYLPDHFSHKGKYDLYSKLRTYFKNNGRSYYLVFKTDRVYIIRKDVNVIIVPEF